MASSLSIPPQSSPALLIESEFGSATAWVVDCRPAEDGYDVTVVTAGHFVTPDNPPPYVLDGSLVTHDTGKTHPTEDFALVTFRSSHYMTPLPLDPRPLVYGEELTLDGFPEGEGPYRRGGFSGGDIRTSTPAWPGDSGGPISDTDGEVVGILVQVIVTPWGDIVSFAAEMVPLVSVNEWLREELQ